MFQKSVIVLAVAAVAIGSLSSAAFAGNARHSGDWGGKHNKAFHFIKITTPHHYKTGCYRYKKLYKRTHKHRWLKKYQACLTHK